MIYLKKKTRNRDSKLEILINREDHQLICWHLEGGIVNSSVIAEFPSDFYPTDMQWHPRPMQAAISSLKKQSLDVLLITTTDGKFTTFIIFKFNFSNLLRQDIYLFRKISFCKQKWSNREKHFCSHRCNHCRKVELRWFGSSYRYDP